jgi:hypothetical protein
MSPRDRAHTRNFSGQPEPIVPPLRERERPGLTETLTGPRDPLLCSSCASRHTTSNPLARWLECDAWDRIPDRPVVVVLCKRCSDKFIEPHPRLYHRLDRFDPFPGCMAVCISCPARRELTCTSPIAQRNGGPGLAYTWKDGAAPMHAHVRVSPPGRSGFRTFYPGRVETCSGKDAADHAARTHDAPA